MKLILLPGLDGSGALFERFLRQLPTSISPQVCPLPPSGPQEFPALVEQIATTLPPDGDIVILAESFSGRLGLELTHRFANRVRGLILVSSFLSVPSPLVAAMRYLPLELAPWHWAPALAFRYLCLGRDSAPELVREVQRTVRKTSAQTIGARIKVLANLQDPSSATTVPTLYLKPSTDWLVPKSHVDAVGKWCSNLKVVEISGPHFLLQARPEQSAAAVMSFLRDLEGRSSGDSTAMNV